MDGSAFRNMNFSWLPWLVALAGLGFLSACAGAAVLLWWVVSHLHWA